MEREHNISQRWTGNTPDFQAIEVIARATEHKSALVSIKEKANEFFYLSSIRRRFLGELRFNAYKGNSLNAAQRATQYQRQPITHCSPAVVNWTD